MTSAEHSKFVMAAQQREQDDSKHLLKDPQAETNELEIHRSDLSSAHSSAPPQTMAPPGIEMASDSRSVDLLASPDKTGERKHRGAAKSRERSPRRARSASGRSGRSDSGSRKPPASRTSSVKAGGPTPRSSRPSSRAPRGVTLLAPLVPAPLRGPTICRLSIVTS